MKTENNYSWNDRRVLAALRGPYFRTVSAFLFITTSNAVAAKYIMMELRNKGISRTPDGVSFTVRAIRSALNNW